MPFFPIQYLKSTGGNFGQVTSRIYRSAQPDQHRLKQFRDKFGLTVNLNLRDDLDSVNEERAEVEALGIHFIWFPMSDSKAPSETVIRGAVAYLAVPGVILVNCKGGRHRTGLVCAAYRVLVDGWSKKEAWSECEDYGFYSFPNHGVLKDWFFEEFKP
jgi:tyrosine-protein phosphatase SIW14